MWDLIVSVPDHCLSFYLELKVKSRKIDYVTHVIPLKMKCTFCVSVKTMKVRGKYFMII